MLSDFWPDDRNSYSLPFTTHSYPGRGFDLHFEFGSPRVCGQYVRISFPSLALP